MNNRKNSYLNALNLFHVFLIEGTVQYMSPNREKERKEIPFTVNINTPDGGVPTAALGRGSSKNFTDSLHDATVFSFPPALESVLGSSSPHCCCCLVSVSSLIL